MWQEKRRFRAVDTRGREYTVKEEVCLLDPRYGQIKGITRFITADMQLLNHIGKGEYEIRANGIILRSDDPAAL